MPFSVSMVREVRVGEQVMAEVALEADGQDVVLFRYDMGAQASDAGNKLRSAVVAARDIVLIE